MSRADTHHYVRQKPPLHCLPQFDPSAIDIKGENVDVQRVVRAQETDRALLDDFKEVFQYFQTTKDPEVRKFLHMARKQTGANEYDPSGPYAGRYKGGGARRQGRQRRPKFWKPKPKRSKQQRKLDAARYKTRSQARKQVLFKFSELNEQGAKAIRAANRNYNFRMSPGKAAATVLIVALLMYSPAGAHEHGAAARPRRGHDAKFYGAKPAVDQAWNTSEWPKDYGNGEYPIKAYYSDNARLAELKGGKIVEVEVVDPTGEIVESYPEFILKMVGLKLVCEMASSLFPWKFRINPRNDPNLSALHPVLIATLRFLVQTMSILGNYVEIED